MLFLALAMALPPLVGGCADDEPLICDAGIWDGDLGLGDGFDVPSGYVEITGALIIGSDDVANLDALGCTTRVGAGIGIQQNPVLSDVSGLGNITSIGGGVLILDNPSLARLDGLDGITEIPGPMWIIGDNGFKSLRGLSPSAIRDAVRIEGNTTLKSVDGLEPLVSVGGRLRITNNDRLEDLDALVSFERLDGTLTIERNARLTSILGLSSLINVEGDLEIVENPKLPTCQVEALRDRLLAAGFAHEIRIWGNDPDCP